VYDAIGGGTGGRIDAGPGMLSGGGGGGVSFDGSGADAGASMIGEETLVISGGADPGTSIGSSREPNERCTEVSRGGTAPGRANATASSWLRVRPCVEGVDLGGARADV
jgi:hypothetical protein